MKKLLLITSIVAAQAALTAVADHHAPSVEGVWYTVGDRPDGSSSEGTLTIKKVEGKLTAKTESESGRVMELETVKWEKKNLSMEAEIDQGNFTGTVGVGGKLNDKGEIKGKWYAKDGNGSELFSGAWTAVRALDKGAAGTWDVVAATDEGDNEHSITLEKSGAKFSGRVSGDGGELEFQKVTVKKNQLTLDFEFGEGSITVKAVQQAANKLVGKWHYKDSFDTEVATGDWTATKRK